MHLFTLIVRTCSAEDNMYKIIINKHHGTEFLVPDFDKFSTKSCL